MQSNKLGLFLSIQNFLCKSKQSIQILNSIKTKEKSLDWNKVLQSDMFLKVGFHTKVLFKEVLNRVWVNKNVSF
jgi:hypothetical protein